MWGNRALLLGGCIFRTYRRSDDTTKPKKSTTTAVTCGAEKLLAGRRSDLKKHNTANGLLRSSEEVKVRRPKAACDGRIVRDE